MVLILRGRSFGFSLEEIRQWLELYETEGTHQQLSAFVDMADRQLEALSKQQAELQRSYDDLSKLRAETAESLSKLGTSKD